MLNKLLYTFVTGYSKGAKTVKFWGMHVKMPSSLNFVFGVVNQLVLSSSLLLRSVGSVCPVLGSRLIFHTPSVMATRPSRVEVAAVVRGRISMTL